MSEFVQGLHKLLDRFSAEPGPDSVVNKHRRRMLGVVAARSPHCLAAVEGGSVMLSLLEDVCRRDVRPKMWRPPAFECGALSETLTKARSGVVADTPPRPIGNLF